jgi:hypothetical protein
LGILYSKEELTYCKSNPVNSVGPWEMLLYWFANFSLLSEPLKAGAYGAGASAAKTHWYRNMKGTDHIVFVDKLLCFCFSTVSYWRK